jgi:hypothetical protein
MKLDEFERRLLQRLDALGPAPRAELPRPHAARLRAGRPDRRVLELPGESRFAELLIGMLREADQGD